MRHYIQNLIVFTAVSFVIIFSYLSVTFTPQNGVSSDPITTPCSSDLLVLETNGIATIENQHLRRTVRKHVQDRADNACKSAQMFAADLTSEGSALFPFRFTAHTEYYVYEKYRGVRVQFYEETGGAHGNVDYYTETILSRKTEVLLTDLLTDHGITEEVFVSTVINSLNGKGDIPFLTPFTTADQARHWHVTDRGILVVTFPPYALAPIHTERLKRKLT